MIVERELAPGVAAAAVGVVIARLAGRQPVAPMAGTGPGKGALSIAEAPATATHSAGIDGVDAEHETRYVVDGARFPGNRV